MNREKLLQVREAILAHKNKFTYSYSIIGGDKAAEIIDEGCGTCGCVAGFTCALFRPQARWTWGGEMEIAADELQLNHAEIRFLFFCDNYEFSRLGYPNPPEHSMHSATADDAIERIDYLLNREVAA